VKGGFTTEESARYDQVSESVEAFSHLTLPLAKRILAVVGMKPSETLLDVGTGTGIIANLAARKVGPDGHVVGIDFSEGMLDRARTYASQEGLDARVEYQLMDAQDLKFPDQSFDCVVSLFTFMHLPDPQRALDGMYRILRPGGRVTIGVGGGPPLVSLRGWVHRFRIALENIGQLRGTVLRAPDFLNSLVKRHLPDPEAQGVVPKHWENPIQALTRLMQKAGFRQPKTDWDGYVTTLTAPQEFWNLQTTFSSFARQRLLNADAGKITAISREFLETCEGVLSRRGRLVYHYAAVFVTGQKP